MKSRFTTFDLQAALAELAKSDAFGLRVVNVYDIDNKTYLIKLSSTDKKMMLLIESGNRIHSTEFEWPKHMMPSGFSMKCRKHLRNKRFVYAKQLGVDRIVDFCFGYNEAAHHLIVELYDRGNIVLTDHEFTILQLLRIRKDNEDVRFAVKERYPVEKAREAEPLITVSRLKEVLQNAKQGEQLKRILNPLFVYGPALLEHCLLEAGFPSGCRMGDDVNIDSDIEKLHSAIEMAERIMTDVSTSEGKGYIIQKREKRPNVEGKSNDEELLTFSEFHPYLFKQHQENPFLECPSFNKAVDEFFSKLESQKLDVKTLQQEKNALKKLENVKQDHIKRLEALQKSQDEGSYKASLIELNLPLVDQAIKVVNSAIANQIDWEEITDIVKEAQSQGDPVACSIKELKLGMNQIRLKLTNPYQENDEAVSSDDEMQENKEKKKPKQAVVFVDIDLGSSAFANARHYHDKRRQAATKEQKTIDASKKALKSAEKKTKETLKEVATSAVINKARKSYWFEKFMWFISSENYLLIAGRDQQQNELLVKRYLRPGDLYVHADLHGASSVILKNPSGQPVPPRTLNEAGTMAICYSAAWQARVVTSAWWVRHDQVSKTAPSGEYLTTGSFMIRGKKNYLPPSYLLMGFGVMFKLDESCLANHKNERRPRLLEDDAMSTVTEATDKTDNADKEIELEASDSDHSVEDDSEKGQSINNESVNQMSQSLDQSSESYAQNAKSADQIDKNDINSKEQRESLTDVENENVKEKENGFEDLQENGEDDDVDVDDDDDDDDEEEEDSLYPDTSLKLQFVGDKFQLQRESSSANQKHDDDYDVVDFGDGEKVVIGAKQEPVSTQKKQRLSAKQRRELKKKHKSGAEDSSENGSKVGETSQPSPSKSPEKMKNVGKSEQKQQQQAKRGHKGKLKKMKEKYKDQDEEDKEIIMQLLGSAGDSKEQKNKKKGKKGSNQSQRPKSGKFVKKPQDQPLILSSESYDGVEHKDDAELSNQASEKLNTIKEDNIEDDEEAQGIEDVDKENISLLDTLTGCPLQDDILLFAVPVCAPYNTMQNYKYKVKVMPGTGRKGKAAKTAIHLFATSKEATQREKDLFKSLKDVDVSRNIPGKVKIAAPNLQKSKK